MQFRVCRPWVCLVAIGVVVAVSSAGVASSGAATGAPVAAPALTVSPSTGLVDLQKVTMTGTGFGANAAIETIECSTGSFTLTTCDVSTLVSVLADKHGAFTLKQYVRRLITVGLTTSRTVDCAAKAGCALVALTNVSSKQPNVAIFFNPKIPPKVPTMTVTPNTKLVDHQLVTVTGKNYAPSSSVSLSECVTGQPTTEFGTPCDSATQRNVDVDGNGAFTATNVVLERTQVVSTDTASLIVDCAAAPNTCDLQTSPGLFDLGSTASATAQAALTFDPSVPVVVASVHASPASQLADMQSITVTGTGFTPSATVTVQECALVSFSIDACDETNANSRTATAGFQGQFNLSFAVRRDLDGAFESTGPTNVDCATTPHTCVLSAQGTDSQAPATAALSFNPKVPAVPETIAASPHTALHDNQNITVSLHGFTPDQPVQIVECSSEAITTGDTSTYCDANTSQTATPTGPQTLQTVFTVQAVIGGEGGLVNCATRPDACVLIATETNNLDIGTITYPIGPDQSNLVSTPLTFATH